MIVGIIILALLCLVFKPRVAEWILFYSLGHLQFGTAILQNFSFFLWYVFYHLPTKVITNIFGDVVEQYYMTE
ncbi:SH (U3) putative protein [Ouango virus]|uniref:Small hydrophobic protein n=1 Tax=Ouango virus TaxID=864692 RepID=A0AAE8XCJ6_9RHAB|nr:SH (U3) putative protein [Ouango virus]UAU42891.1 SH (U3) putative protein [Ouango virus]